MAEYNSKLLYEVQEFDDKSAWWLLAECGDYEICIQLVGGLKWFVHELQPSECVDRCLFEGTGTSVTHCVIQAEEVLKEYLLEEKDSNLIRLFS